MLFKLQYFLMAAGYNAMGILLGVYMRFYTKASPTEIGILYMLMPFIGMACRPIVSSFADRNQAYQKYLMVCLASIAICYSPFIVLPFMGPEVYEEHHRFCWYFLVSFKVVGDVSYGCAATIGDSLAVNYSKRIGTELSYYRVGGTISFMIFGVITGQLNEIPSLPKYVAGFMVLVSASLLYMLAVYLWPCEYFVMVTPSIIEKEAELRNKKPPSSPWTRSLMPKEVVWSHAKSRLWALISCSCCKSTSLEGDEQRASKVIPFGSVTEHEEQSSGSNNNNNNKSIDKRTQLLTLLLLLRRDPRIMAYWLVFVAAGASMMPVSFFLMSLSEICHTNNRCNFSQLAGFLQVSMSLTETLWLLCLKRVVQKLGRLNTVSMAFGLVSLKYLFYGTIWPSVSPNYSILAEAVHGIIYGTFVVSMNELSYSFALEVEHLLPELVSRGMIGSDDQASQEKLKLSLLATMQALLAGANEGLGRGFGSLAYGFIVGAYSYQTLFLIVGFGGLFVFIVLLTISLLDHFMNFKLGLSGVDTAPLEVNSKAIQDTEA